MVRLEGSVWREVVARRDARSACLSMVCGVWCVVVLSSPEARKWMRMKKRSQIVSVSMRRASHLRSQSIRSSARSATIDDDLILSSSYSSTTTVIDP